HRPDCGWRRASAHDTLALLSNPGRGSQMAASADSRTLDVSQYLQSQKFGRYHLTVLILCSLVTFFDGQDFSALAYALPYIRDDMQITDEMTGYVSSAAFL